MTRKKANKGLCKRFQSDGGRRIVSFLRPIVRAVIQEFLEAEMVGGGRRAEGRARSKDA